MHLSLVVFAVMAAQVPGVALTPATQAAADDSVGKCFAITGKASYRGFGYKHIVTVTNNCSAAIECEVWTDVDPTPKHTLTVPKGESKDIVTRVGSPASEFKANGTCKAPRTDDA